MIKGILLTGLVFTLVHCGPTRPGSNPTPLQEEAQIVLLDRKVKRHLNLVKAKTEMLPGGQVKLRVAFENEENRDLSTDIQVVFRGDDGFEVEKTSWESFVFHRRKVTTFEKNSLKSGIRDFRILIRTAK